MTKRMGHTGREMEQSGEWNKVGRKHYAHISGIEVRYDCNRWAWEVVGKNEMFPTLWAARHRAEHFANEAGPKVYRSFDRNGNDCLMTVPE